MKDTNKPVRTNFPVEPDSDGWVHKTAFQGQTLHEAYDNLKEFLKNQGYQDIPVPKSIEELLLFVKDGSLEYKHNPISIHFSAYQENELWLFLYNENFPNHLLMFQGVFDHDKIAFFKKNEANRAIEFVKNQLKHKPEIAFDLSQLETIKSTLLSLEYSTTVIVAGILFKPYLSNIIQMHDIVQNFGNDVFTSVLSQSHHIV